MGAAPWGGCSKDKDYNLYQNKSFQQWLNQHLKNTPVNTKKTVLFTIDVKLMSNRRKSTEMM